MFGRWIEKRRLFSWLCFTVLATGSAVFQSNADLKSLLVDANTGQLYAGAVNFIYKLDSNLNQMAARNTKCVAKVDSCHDDNVNLVLLIDNLSSPARLLACGTEGRGGCILCQMNNLSDCLVAATSVLSDNKPASIIAFVDPVNHFVLFGITDDPKGIKAYEIKSSGLVSRGILKSLSRDRLSQSYIFGQTVGKYRYFFVTTERFSSVVRMCEKFVDLREIDTYLGIPLSCNGRDGQIFNQLRAARVLKPGIKLAKALRISVNDFVLLGLFHNSTTSQSGVCVHSFAEMDNYFGLNIKHCFKSTTSDPVSLNRYSGDKDKCKNENLNNCPPSGSHNKRMMGHIGYRATAVVTCSNCSFSTSLDSTVYRDDTIAFLGTTTGNLAKVVISSNSSGRIYEMYPRIPGEDIVSVNTAPNGSYIYLMSKRKIAKIPVQECSNRHSCKSCVEGGDPYCGWCTLYHKCTLQSECPDASSQLGYVQNLSNCINILDIQPGDLPLSNRSQRVNVSIDNLPPRNLLSAYDCYVNHIKVNSTMTDNRTLVCHTPPSAELPSPSRDTGKVSVNISLHSVETKIVIVSASVDFYDCRAISSCLKCTTGVLKCSWCYYKAACVGDASDTCQNSFVPWVSMLSSHKCPLLKPGNVFIPASIAREVVINGKHFPKPEPSDGNYKCIVTVASQSFPVRASWNNETSLTCARYEYKYSAKKTSVPGELRVELGSSVIEPEEGKIAVEVYKCHVAADLCGNCLGLKKSEYRCGWCSSSTRNFCGVRDACSPRTWLPPNAKCKAIPRITSFYPPSGPVEGNTLLEINGTELGSKPEDVSSVEISGVPCTVIKDKYVVAKRIVCRTNSTSKSFSSRIRVVVSGKEGFSNETFHYQEPIVQDFSPKLGPVSGGTMLTITGQDLDTGRNIIVSLGDLPCVLTSKVEKTIITCNTSKVASRKRRATDSVKIAILIVTFDGSPAKSSPSDKFNYVPDPNITNIMPLYSFPSSVQPVTVTGTNLDAIQFPKLQLLFSSKSFSSGCGKATKNGMVCTLPNITSVVANTPQTATFALFLDGVKKWQDLSSRPKFNRITFFPDPQIFPFKEVYTLVDDLKIEGKNLQPRPGISPFDFLITVGGQRCNVTSRAQTVIYCNAPKRSSLPELDSYDVVVNVTSSKLVFRVGKLVYDQEKPSETDLFLVYVIAAAGGAVLILFVVILCCMYRRKKKQQLRKERSFEMQMNSLESKVAKECREAFAELQTDMTDFTSDLGGVGIHFFDFKNYAMRVLFPGVEHHIVMEEKRPQESPTWEEALRTFSQLIGNKNFLLIFVKTLESQQQFKMQDRCSVASLLVIALQHKMDYCTDILQHLLAELIRKSMSKSHPKLLLRRTECIAEKLLTNWLTFTLSSFIKDKAGKPLFMLYKAIKFQVEKGPIDVITNEARYSLSEDKLLRQSIEYNTLTVTVEFEDDPPVQVDVLDTDTIDQAKSKIMEVLFKNTPYSCRIPKDELHLKWVESPSNHRILRDEDSTSVVEGEWKRINTLGHYQVPNRTCLRLVRRFASPLDTSDLQTSLPKVSYSPSIHSNQSFMRSSRNNMNDADIKPWHLTKHIDFVQEKDDPRHSKLLSEIYLTRLLSTKGTLQQYVDDLLDAIFPRFRKNERPPLPIKFLFDFLDNQAKELNITDTEVLHTWKNNSLPLRFWVNLIKNPNFLFDVYKAPIVDSCLTVIAQLFMDACSVSEHRLGKDSPSNKLLYAKEIPAYKQKVESFYEDVSNAPRLTEEEISEFCSSHYVEDFNIDNALKELYKYAAKYQDELQEALEDARYPQLASKLEHVVAIFSDD